MFYDVVLEKGRREEEVGSILAVGGGNTIATVTIGPEVEIKRYDFLTVRRERVRPAADVGSPGRTRSGSGLFSASL